MNIQRIAAFSQGEQGGNPAGVVLLEQPINEGLMRKTAADVGYSETAFAFPLNPQRSGWRVRYFSPESEVPFCGHATIALGAALGEAVGAGTYQLSINNADISVTVEQREEGSAVTLTSPPTKSQSIADDELNAVLKLFSLSINDLSAQLAPAFIHGGSDHVVLPLKSREALARMNYSLADGRQLMTQLELVTIMLVYIENESEFVVRNAFASGGVLEDPATGAAAAAFAGYLRDCDWPHKGSLLIKQGEDMGQPSLIQVMLSDIKGSPVKVSGHTRKIQGSLSTASAHEGSNC